LALFESPFWTKPRDYSRTLSQQLFEIKFMPLSVLVIIVAVGLALVIGAVHYFGGKRTGSLSEEVAENAWQREFADDEIMDVIVCDDRNAAILTLQNTNAVGLVRQMGAHHIGRRFEAGSVSRVKQSGKRLDLKLIETTFPRISLEISDDNKRRAVLSMLEKISVKGEQVHA